MGSFKISKYNDKNTVQPYLSFLLFKILTCWILEKKDYYVSEREFKQIKFLTIYYSVEYFI